MPSVAKLIAEWHSSLGYKPPAPELTVTLEPSPPISKSEQLAVIVSVLPETSVQSADNT